MSAKVRVTRRALFQRLARRLEKDGERLQTCRTDSQWSRDLGRYYAVNERNHISRTDIDLARLAKELGVLKDWEAAEDD